MKRLLVLTGILMLASLAGGYAFFARAPVYRVAGPSMAPALLGPHYNVTCPTCGHDFPIDATRGPVPTATCDDCGAIAPVKTDDIRAGDALETITGEIERFDLVMFPDPDDPLQRVVKRVVGLPGETIACRDGDLWIDGERYQKRWKELSRVMIPVYQVADNLASDPRISITADGWIQYHHQVHSQGIQITGAAPPLDDYPYNQGLPGKLHPLNELICTFVRTPDGPMEVVFGFEQNDFLLRDDPPGGRTICYLKGDEIQPLRVSQSADSNDLPRQESAVVHACVCDQLLQLGTGDRGGGVTVPYQLQPGNCTALPLRIHPGKGKIESLKIFRDIRYADFPETKIPTDAYFVLGDNVPASRDSRHFGVIAAKNARRMDPASKPD
ncbi:signal peptidase I [Blastopirellula marina]|uniref:Signal peptidase I n=1 Tax=Blastopirellula marina DSM 3645 TaxID=314230 RepID=A3ZMQ1_9BACT|nr:signal peptidase I [Blastopirellula marina]EAQ82227.1 probable signal peptidase I [Blastopirellula marina DSM 3645]